MPKPKLPASIRVLSPEEYPPEITAARGAYTPDVRFAATHPLGLYHVEHHGAGHLQAMFTPRKKGSRARAIGGASDLAGAMRRILRHEDEVTSPEAPRERGESGPVSVFALGRRTHGEEIPRTQPAREIAREIDAYLQKVEQDLRRASRLGGA